MRRLWWMTLAATLALPLGGCSGGGSGDPGGEATPPPDEPSATPRPQTGTWTRLADLPQARTELSAAVLDGQVYVGTGLTRGPGDEAFYRYDPASDSWHELAPIPAARHHAPLAAHDGIVYLVGGYDNQASDVSLFGTPTDTLFVYDVAGDAWREGPPLPEPVGAHAVATTDDGMIHVVGGLDQSALDARDEHLVFDTGTGNWSSLPPMPSSREHLGAAHLDGVVYVVAGRTGGRGVAFEAYDIEAAEWSVLPDVPTGRGGVGVVAFQGQIYVLGGETVDQTFDQAERFDPGTGRWQEVSPMPTARHGLGAVALDDGVMAISGGPDVGLTHSADTEIWRP
jgi:N-acetylneuraminic acid mutarotase